MAHDYDGHDHHHDDEEHEGEPQQFPDELDPAWGRERIELRSVGIDIGSSTSHLTFSRLILRRMGAVLSSRFHVVQREILHQSPILLTPYLDAATIDTGVLKQFIASSYEAAGIRREAIDAGAVIATGEAAKKENAAAITALFAEEAGKFVCATAGPTLESIMAAHGAGAVAKSSEGRCVLNVDIGGGTSKLALCEGGAVTDTSVVNVGGRLVAWDDEGRVARLEDAGRLIAEACGLSLSIGTRLTEEMKRALAERMADCLIETMEGVNGSGLTKSLMITSPFGRKLPVEAVMFSGGVSEYYYGRETREFGDLGKLLGSSLKERLSQHRLGSCLAQSEERIRATVIGASQYTVQVSGSTIYVSQPDLLPLRNLPVLSPRLETATAEGVERAIAKALDGHDRELIHGPFALAMAWPFEPSYPNLLAFAQGVRAALEGIPFPLVLVFDKDIARLAGRLLTDEIHLPDPVIAVDEVALEPFDYIDLGLPLPEADAVPIVIKSLVFRPSKK
jgi:ethanolamine utilization protein EutA